MTHCLNCGAQVPDDIRFCTSCGTPVAANSRSAQAEAVAAPAAPQPVETKEAPISTGGWFGILFLLALPALNLLFLVIWAVGGTGRVNKKNFARAVLLWMVTGIVLSILVAVVFSILFAGSGGIEGIKELILEKIAATGAQQQLLN